MRNWIIGAAALVALAVPGVAAAQTGYVGVQYGNSDNGTTDSDFYGAEGAVAFAGSGSIVFEVNASYTDIDQGDAGYGLVGHVYSRNDDTLFGGFVGVSGSDNNDGYIVGLEANKYYTNWTLAGAVAYADADNGSDGYGVNAEGRFFVNDNFRLDARLGWANIDTGAGDSDGFAYGVGGEYQLASVPVSFTARYGTIDTDNGDVDTLSVGLRYNWGGTLRDRDRNGASQASIVGIGGLY